MLCLWLALPAALPAAAQEAALEAAFQDYWSAGRAADYDPRRRYPVRV